MLACLAVACVLAYGLAGHGLPTAGAHDGMAGVAAGLCALFLTSVLVSRRRPAAPTARVAHGTRLAPTPACRPATVDVRARASPAVLQRFRN